MTTNLERSLLRSVQRAREDAAIHASELKAWRDTNPIDRIHLLPHAAPGDQARLRGIPVIGGAPGHIPNTRPDTHRLDTSRTTRYSPR